MHREYICSDQSARKLHRLSRREVMAQASTWDFVSHVEQKQFDLICNSSFCFCHNKRSWIVRLHAGTHGSGFRASEMQRQFQESWQPAHAVGIHMSKLDFDREIICI